MACVIRGPWNACKGVVTCSTNNVNRIPTAKAAVSNLFRRVVSDGGGADDNCSSPNTGWGNSHCIGSRCTADEQLIANRWIATINIDCGYTNQTNRQDIDFVVTKAPIQIDCTE